MALRTVVPLQAAWRPYSDLESASGREKREKEYGGLCQGSESLEPGERNEKVIWLSGLSKQFDAVLYAAATFH